MAAVFKLMAFRSFPPPHSSLKISFLEINRRQKRIADDQVEDVFVTPWLRSVLRPRSCGDGKRERESLN